MKKDIHPKYYDQAEVICACGSRSLVGSTMPTIKVEICGACHPFYTGKDKVMDTAGRVEKFTRRSAQATAPKAKKVKVAKKAN